MNAMLRDVLFRDPLMKAAGLQYVWPLDEATGLVRQSYSPPWACVPSAHLLPVNGPTQGSALISGPAGSLACASASSQYCTTPHQTSLQSSPSGWWGCVWHKPTTTQFQGLFSRYGGASEYYVGLSNVGPLYRFVSYSSGTPTVTAATPTVSSGSTYFVLVWFDPAKSVIGIRINNGTIYTVACTAMTMATSPFDIGSIRGTYPLDGSVQYCMLGFPKVSIGNVIDRVSNTLYANGAGLDLVWRMPLPYPPGRPLIGVEPILWCEADYGTYQTAGGSAAAADGDPVGYWTDRSVFGNHPVQATSTKRATLKTNQLNGYPVLRFDGVDDRLEVTLAGYLNLPFTVFSILKVPSAYDYETCLGATNELYSVRSGPTYYFYNGTSSVFTGVNSLGWNIVSTKVESSLLTINVNGGSDQTFSISPNHFGTTFSIGSKTDTGNLAAMDVAAVIVVPGALSSAQITRMFSVLNAKYAVY